MHFTNKMSIKDLVSLETTDVCCLGSSQADCDMVSLLFILQQLLFFIFFYNKILIQLFMRSTKTQNTRVFHLQKYRD